MRLNALSRTRKVKILSKLFDGQPAPFRHVRQAIRVDYFLMTDEEQAVEYERLRQKEYRETGIMPPPKPDYSTMSDEELERCCNELNAILQSS